MKKWELYQIKNKTIVNTFVEYFKIQPITAQLLLNRGINTIQEAEEFFNPDITKNHSPFLMKDMDIASELVLKHLKANHKIMIYGDYDVDGTTSVALVYSFLKQFTDNLIYYIPDRYNEGYGISEQGIKHANQYNCKLIISLDCGIKAFDEIQLARNFDIDFIVCDHHRPSDKLPNATAILDPKRTDCSYPYKELSGCGVGFKLVQAIAQKKNLPFSNLEPLLDLLAISIGADIVEITGENRIFAHYGLKILNKNKRPGIWTFFKDKDPNSTIKMEDVIFKIAPRINAAGRIAHAHAAIEMLIEEDYNKAENFCAKIEDYNKERKDLDSNITIAALKQAENQQTEFTTVVFNKNWHKGVIGIVASRLIENKYRPTIVFTEKEGILTGSARSIPNFDLYLALDACSEHIEQFGGHYFAAGLQIKKENLESFKNAFENYASTILTKTDLVEKISLESELKIEAINEDLYKEIEKLQPFGPKNLPPVFGAKNLKCSQWSKPVGEDNKHLSISVINGKQPIKAIAFGLGEKYSSLIRANSFALAFSLSENYWKGKSNIQLMVKDIKFKYTSN